MGKRGGKREGAGRRRNNPPTKRQYLYLTEAQIHALLVWGKGDMSAGARWLIDNAAIFLRKQE